MMVSGIPDAGAAYRADGVRVMVCLVDGCRVAIPLDAIEETHDAGSAAQAAHPSSQPAPLVDWCDLTGVPREPGISRKQVLVVRTPTGPIGFGSDQSLGIRELSLGSTPAIPTEMRDAAGEPLCFLLVIDREPYFLLDPRALARAEAAAGVAEPPSKTGAPGH
jgi:hypothetical protein